MKFICITLLFISLSARSDNANEILDQLRENLNSIQADFTQVELLNNGEQSETSSGQMWLNKPNQFRWNYTQPIPQLIIANGEKVWIYDEDLEQVTIRQQNIEQNPLYTLLDKELTEKNYQLSIVENTDQKKQIIELKPIIESEEIKSVWLTIEKQNLKQIKIENSLANQVIFDFENIIKNPKLEAGFFNFEPPAGTDIIQDSLFNNENSFE